MQGKIKSECGMRRAVALFRVLPGPDQSRRQRRIDVAEESEKRTIDLRKPIALVKVTKRQPKPELQCSFSLVSAAQAHGIDSAILYI
jgi:hypothetical protein